MSVPMMAKTAHDKSQTVECGIHKNLYYRLHTEIKRAVDNGYTECSLEMNATDVVKKKLREEGYTVSVKNKNSIVHIARTVVKWRRPR